MDYSFPSDIKLSSGARSIISGIFVKNPSTRLSIKDIIEHPWFRCCAASCSFPRPLPQNRLV